MRSLTRILRFTSQLWKFYLGVVISAVIVAITQLAVPFVIARATDLAVAGVRGTIFLVEATKEDTYICSCSGSVEVQSKKAGEFKSVLTTKEEVHRGFKVQPMSGQITQKSEARHSHTDDEAKAIMAKLKK